MDGQKRANFIQSAGLKSGLYLCWIDVQRARINVCKDRTGAGADDGAGGSKKTERIHGDAILTADNFSSREIPYPVWGTVGPVGCGRGLVATPQYNSAAGLTGFHRRFRGTWQDWWRRVPEASGRLQDYRHHNGEI